VTGQELAGEQPWPDVLWIARHGQSAGNVARDAAEAGGHPLIDIADRDADVPLSALGEQQAAALGRWLGAMPGAGRPNVVLTSPYVRARETAAIALRAADMDAESLTVIVDERLREREFGILDRLTKHGIRERYPEQAEFYSHLGKFYHRPPGGESWCDVILRLRSVVDTISRDFCRERVLIVSHQVVVLCFRYLLECMTEEEILAIDRARDIANCGITSYEFDPAQGLHGKLALRLSNFVAPLEEAGAPVTRKPDVPVAPK
jgi:broad specificity phosphatase PhoE